MQAEHFVRRDPGDGLAEGDERWTIGGYYVNELIRQPGGWKLAKVTLNATWRFGNPEVPQIALARGRAESPRRDETDR